MNKPNIVYILADDMGFGDISSLNDKSKIKTKHIDKMTEEGMTFTDAHASSSVCTPSRYGLLTGRYAWRGRLKRGVLFPFGKPLIEKDQKALPQLLKNNGYNTACIGKWHLGMDYPFRHEQNTDNLQPSDMKSQLLLDKDIDYTKTIKNGPTSYGFDYYFGVDVPNFPPYCFIENDKTVGIPDRLKPDDMYGHPGSMVEGWDFKEVMPSLTDKAVDYIEEKADNNEPFFLYFSLTGPHTPIAPTEDFIGKSGAGIYGDYCLQMDHSVGIINEALKRNNIEENTLLIFASDNGSPGKDGDNKKPGSVFKNYEHNPSWLLRGLKGDTWDGGHRIPFIAKWPSRIPQNTKCDEIVCLIDFMATCCSILNIDIPENTGRDSFNILPYLENREIEEPVRDHVIHHGANGLYGIRKGPWKLIFGTGSGGLLSPSPRLYKDLTIYDMPGQLYNMDDDIGETTNLYEQYPDIVYELSSLFLETYGQY